MPFATEQEQFWAGDFGDEYTKRNRGEQIVASNTAFFARILARMPTPASVVELGANIGMNLLALRRLLPEARLAAVEINDSAARELRRIEGVAVTVGSLFDYAPEAPADLAFIKGVLIHIDPSMLAATYRSLVASTHRYLLVCEYYNPSPVSIPYRGHADRLYKRDFAGELLEQFAELSLVDYGFVYRRDPAFPQDDITWFLLQKAP